MHPSHRLAELLVVAWKLSDNGDRIPTSHGILDKALKAIHESSAMPEWARDLLHFSSSRVGLQCIELPDILEWAQRSQLTSAPNPSYETVQIQISSMVAESFFEDLNVDREQLRQFGIELADAIQCAKSEASEFEYARIEEY